MRRLLLRSLLLTLLFVGDVVILIRFPSRVLRASYANSDRRNFRARRDDRVAAELENCDCVEFQ